MPTYLHLLRGNTLKLYAGISEDIIKEKAKLSHDYSYATFGVDSCKKDGKFTKDGEVGEILHFTANCGDLTPRKFKVKISVCPTLYSYGIPSFQDLREEGDLGPIRVSVLLTKSIKVSDVKELVRIYICE